MEKFKGILHYASTDPIPAEDMDWERMEEERSVHDLLDTIKAMIAPVKPTFIAMHRKDYIRYTIKRKPYRMVSRLKKKTS